MPPASALTLTLTPAHAQRSPPAAFLTPAHAMTPANTKGQPVTPASHKVGREKS
jgi:hypothetical protein